MPRINYLNLPGLGGFCFGEFNGDLKRGFRECHDLSSVDVRSKLIHPTDTFLKVIGYVEEHNTGYRKAVTPDGKPILEWHHPLHTGVIAARMTNDSNLRVLSMMMHDIMKALGDGSKLTELHLFFKNLNGGSQTLDLAIKAEGFLEEKRGETNLERRLDLLTDLVKKHPKVFLAQVFSHLENLWMDIQSVKAIGADEYFSKFHHNIDELTLFYKELRDLVEAIKRSSGATLLQNIADFDRLSDEFTQGVNQLVKLVELISTE